MMTYKKSVPFAVRQKKCFPPTTINTGLTITNLFHTHYKACYVRMRMQQGVTQFLGNNKDCHLVKQVIYEWKKKKNDFLCCYL